MKTYNLSLLITCVIILLTVSCRKHSSSPTVITGPSISATINGKAYQSTYIVNKFESKQGSALALNLYLFNFSPGKYAISDVEIIYFTVPSAESNKYYSIYSHVGALTIASKTDSTISGTFSATLYKPNLSDSVKITNGVFSNLLTK